MHLSTNPLCVSCHEPGNEVDHIIDHKGNTDLFFDADNLQTLCKKCHAKKTFADADFYKLPRTNDITATINLVDESQCDMLKLQKALGVQEDTDYLYSLLAKSNDNIFNLSRKSYIIKLYKLISTRLQKKPKLKTNSADIQQILSEE